MENLNDYSYYEGNNNFDKIQFANNISFEDNFKTDENYNEDSDIENLNIESLDDYSYYEGNNNFGENKYFFPEI